MDESFSAGTAPAVRQTFPVPGLPWWTSDQGRSWMTGVAVATEDLATSTLSCNGHFFFRGVHFRWNCLEFLYVREISSENTLQDFPVVMPCSSPNPVLGFNTCSVGRKYGRLRLGLMGTGITLFTRNDTTM